jgi:HEAT repeat protein
MSPVRSREGRARWLALVAAPAVFCAQPSGAGDAADTLPSSVAQLESTDTGLRREAAMHLGAMGPSAAGAVPALLKVLHRSSVAEGDEDVPAVAWALGQVGERGVDALIDELRSRHELIHEPVIDGLVGSGKAAVPLLVAALGEGNDYLRDAVAQALGGIGPGAREAVPALIEAARHRSAQDMPIWALGKIGPVTKDVVPFLTRLQELLRDTSPTVRAAAAGTLGRIGPAAKDAIPALEAALGDESRYVRSEVSEALKKIRVTNQ